MRGILLFAVYFTLCKYHPSLWYISSSSKHLYSSPSEKKEGK
ncbi:unnamed protein product [Brassica rapa subsp. narinosa]|uniref:(rape) hypothetical protein n=1 Tax=Brassica napus TaxID=3708 RepID=A0A816ZE34_BRANA|nr:unnamed protein product [Brassica napus]